MVRFFERMEIRFQFLHPKTDFLFLFFFFTKKIQYWIVNIKLNKLIAQVDSLDQKSKSGLYDLRSSCCTCSRRNLFLKLHLYVVSAYLGISCFSVNTPKRKDQKKGCFTLYIVYLISIPLRTITF